MKNYTRNLMIGGNEIIVTTKTAADVYTYPSAHELNNAYDLVYGSTEKPFPYISKYLCDLVVDFLNRNKRAAAIGLGFEPVYTNHSGNAYTFVSRNQYVKSTGQKANCDIVCNYSGSIHNWSNRYLRIQEDIIPLMNFCKSVAEKRKKEIAAKNRKIRDKNTAIFIRRHSSAIGKFFAPATKEYISEANDEFIKLIPEVNDLYGKLSAEINHINQEQTRFERKQAWIQKYYGQAFLIIQSGTKYQIFFEKECNFSIVKAKNDIRNAVTELQEEQTRAENSANSGERAVEYALKWFFAGCGSYIVTIKNNCSSSYRDNCILLSKPEFIDEPQEYDHILVGSFGVAVIETKHWKGKIKITSDGKWLRYRDDSTEPEGIANPKAQIKRHEILLQSILPNVPIHSILCLSNDTAVIEGASNFTDYSLVRLDQLGDALSKLLSVKTYTNAGIDAIVQQIEQHKVSVASIVQDTQHYDSSNRNGEIAGLIRCNRIINPSNSRGQYVIEGTVLSESIETLGSCGIEFQNITYRVDLIQQLPSYENVKEATKGQTAIFTLYEKRH